MSLAEEERIAPPVAAADRRTPPSRPSAAAPAARAVKPRKPRAKRKIALGGVTLAVVLAGAAYGVYYWLYLSHYESTDNAYVQGNVVQVTPQVGGTVVAINADDTDFVKAGQSLVRLDPADAQVALDQAEAQLAQTVREVRTMYVNNGSLKAQIAAREADIARAQSDVLRAQDDVARRAPLVRTGAVGKEEFNHVTAQLAAAKSGLAAAQSATEAAREQLASNQSLTENIPVEQHPERAARRRARARGLPRAAPRRAGRAGRRLRRQAQRAARPARPGRRAADVGGRAQRASGSTPTSRKASCGTCASASRSSSRPTSTARRSTYHGTIEGLGAGTGAAFALLPAQNATGNWIKVVQRVPVRIALDAKEVAEHPLRVGLSMDATVDVSQHRRHASSPTSRSAPARAQTSVFDQGNDAGRRRGARRSSPPTSAAASAPTRAAPHRGARAAARRRRWRRARLPSRRADGHREPRCAAAGAGPGARAGGAADRAAARRRARARHDRAVAGDVHERARHVDRQRLDPGDLGRPRRQPVAGHLGHHLVRRRQRDLGAAHRLADAALRPGAPVRRQHPAVRDRVVAVRPGAEHRHADRVPRPAGLRRRADDPALADAAAVELSARQGGHARWRCGR